MTSDTRANRLIPAALIALAFVPLVAGGVRLAELTGDGGITPQNARFFASPLPIVLHVLSGALFCGVGAFQFAPGFRRRRPAWHRIAGRVLVACGLVAGLSGLWMTLFYPRAPGDGLLLDGFRLVFGTAMVVSIVLSLAAILRRDVARHSAWMIRGYAIGMGAGTQALVTLPWVLVVGTPDVLERALLLGAGWVINVAFAEWIIRRPLAARVRTLRHGLTRVSVRAAP